MNNCCLRDISAILSCHWGRTFNFFIAFTEIIQQLNIHYVTSGVVITFHILDWFPAYIAVNFQLVFLPGKQIKHYIVETTKVACFCRTHNLFVKHYFVSWKIYTAKNCPSLKLKWSNEIPLCVSQFDLNDQFTFSKRPQYFPSIVKVSRPRWIHCSS